RRDLQLDMSLVGVENDAGAATIDASTLLQSSFNFKIGRTGIIRTGRGNNTIEWLTVRGNPLAAAAISTDLLQKDLADIAMPTTIRVAHVVAGGSARGVDIRNATAETEARRIVGEIEDSEFYWGVEGIRVANFVGADNGEITVDMRRNHSHQNRLGCIIENNRSNNATIAVTSDGDQFDDNGLGCLIGGGLTNAQTASASFNTTRFDAHGSRFTNNIRTVFNTAAGGPQFIAPVRAVSRSPAVSRYRSDAHGYQRPPVRRDTRRSAVPGETGSRIVTHPRRSELGRTRRAVVSSKARSGHSPNPVHLSDPVADAVPDRRSRLLDRVDRRSS